MKFTNALYPTEEQMLTLAGLESDRPVCMVNLLKYREKAQYEDGSDSDISGREAYRRYAEPMSEIVIRGGGRFHFKGAVNGLIVGDVEDLWDDVAIVEYPSQKGFIEIALSDEVRAISGHRAAGLEGQLNIITTESEALQSEGK
jgi:uncharacterized protein (DUF1330 family)